MTKKPDLWMPFYVGDYLADTMHLSTAEHGAYVLLLCHGWMNDGRIPADEDELATVSHLGQAWPKSRKKLLAFFTREGDHLVQKRQVVELQRAKATQQSLQAKGKSGAVARWQRHAPGNAPANGPSNGPGIRPEPAKDGPGNARAMPRGMPGDAPSPPPSPLQSQSQVQLTAAGAVPATPGRGSTNNSRPMTDADIPGLCPAFKTACRNAKIPVADAGAELLKGRPLAWVMAWLLATEADVYAKAKTDDPIREPLAWFRDHIDREPPERWMAEAKAALARAQQKELSAEDRAQLAALLQPVPDPEAEFQAAKRKVTAELRAAAKGAAL